MTGKMKKITSIILAVAMIVTALNFVPTADTISVEAAEIVASADFTKDNFDGKNMSFKDTNNQKDEPYTYVTSKSGVQGRHVDSGKYLYMKVGNDAVTQDDHNLFIDVTYFDEGTDSFAIQYNAINNDGTNAKNYSGVNITKAGSGTWITTTICLEDASFRHAQNNQCDFRISGAGEQGTTISKISITKQSVDPKAEPIVTLNRDTKSSEFKGKTFAGYQGWFGTGGQNNSWQHYAYGDADADGTKWPRKNHISIDVYPDVSEYADSSVAQTGFENLGNGKPAKLFDSNATDVINTHFRWMKEYGIDGAAIQRFVAGIKGRTITRTPESTQLYKIKKAAEQNDRLTYVMYDISGGTQITDTSDTTSISSYVKDIEFDWVYNIEQSLKMLDSTSYATVNGKPVVCLWGVGVSGRPNRKADYQEMINFFKERGCYIIFGVARDWRSQNDYLDIYKQANMITPWYVGAFGDEKGVDNVYNNYLQPDVNYCKSNSLDYYPVVFSGFTWALWQNGKPNKTSRNAGQFFWYQVYKLKQLGIDAFYVAMFDEYDEGTAIAKNASDYFDIPTDQYFVTASCDGYWLSTDYQLRVAGESIRMVKGQREAVKDVPVAHSLGPVYYRNSFESMYVTCKEAAYSGDYPVDPCFKNNAQVLGTNASSNATIEKTSSAKTGNYDVKFSGTANATNAKTEYRISETKIKLGNVMKLSYSMKAGNEAGKNTYVDLICDDGTRISSKNIKNGSVSLGEGSPKGNTSNWTDYEFTFETEELEGKNVTAVALCYSGNAAEFTAYYDNIILEDGEQTGTGESVVSDYTSGSYVGTNMEYVANINTETEGATILNENGKYGLKSQKGKYVYYKVLNNAVTENNHELYVHITYLDKGTDWIYLQYNSQNDGNYKSSLIQRNNTGNWITATVKLEDAAFAGKQNNGASFRIGSNDDEGAVIAKIVITKTPEVPDEKVDDSLLHHGRTWYEGDELMLAWTNSGFTMRFSGTGATARITSTTIAELVKGYLNIYVDGDLVPTSTICLDATSGTYTLAEGLDKGEHTITVKKRNEAAYGGNATIGVSNIQVVDGELLSPPEEPSRKIEFVGDSITSGFTNMVEDGNGGYQTSNMEGTMTYAALTGKAFGVEANVISRSGIRIVRTNTGQSMIDYYPQVSGLTGNTNPWNFNGGSDVVVINLGTNDGGAKMDSTDSSVVSDDYVKSEAKVLLSLVREKNPNAVIIWAYGIMGQGRAQAIQNAMKEMNDNKMYYFSFDGINQNTDGIAVGGHPTITTGINRSFDLTEFIAEITGWDYNYETQLATELKLLEGYNDETLRKYTQESASNFVNVRNEAVSLSKNSSSATLKKAVGDLQAARNALVLATNGDNYDPNASEKKKYDFVVTDISWEPQDVTEGQQVVFKAVVKNIGEGDAPAGTKLGVSFRINDDTNVTWSDTWKEGLKAGESIELTANGGNNNINYWTAVKGAHTVTATVNDVKDYPDEANIENNTKESAITVREKETSEPTTETATVTVDGIKVEVVDNKITLGDAKYGYLCNQKMYAPNTEVEVTKDMVFTSVNKLSMRMVNGAGIRYIGTAGIRFKTTIVSDNMEAVASEAITEGTLITANDIYEAKGTPLTLTSDYTKLNVVNEGWYKDEVGTYCGSICDIIESNYIRNFTARAYITVNYENADAITIYSKMGPVRSISEVAAAVKEAKYPDIVAGYENTIDSFIK